MAKSKVFDESLREGFPKVKGKYFHAKHTAVNNPFLKESLAHSRYAYHPSLEQLSADPVGVWKHSNLLNAQSNRITQELSRCGCDSGRATPRTVLWERSLIVIFENHHGNRSGTRGRDRGKHGARKERVGWPLCVPPTIRCAPEPSRTANTRSINHNQILIVSTALYSCCQCRSRFPDSSNLKCVRWINLFCSSSVTLRRILLFTRSFLPTTFDSFQDSFIC